MTDDRIRAFPDLPHGPSDGPIPDALHASLDHIVRVWREADDLADKARELEDEARNLQDQSEDKDDEASDLVDALIEHLPDDWAAALHQRTDPPGMTRRLVFHVPGKPVSQGSMIQRPHGGITHSNPALPWWRHTVAEYAERAANDQTFDVPITGAVGMRIDFVFDRPSFHFGTGKNADRLKPGAPVYPIKPPDLDKLVRAILDAISIDTRILADDSQVVWVQTSKTYAMPGQSAGVVITIGAMA